ncbi:hypothetical protein OsJ_19668 [Oryza sativa Japonica Group]|uniref:Uncharacterized protein n=1 Tax=Oryza sativa subsp. japonica TaxID=39947 RepID=B9FLS1_ORYSJ|nr:hypothetical protein OsJ_19668 [Oryza sativa Japonica Group]
MARRDCHHTHDATDWCVVADRVLGGVGQLLVRLRRRFEVDPWRRVGGEQDLQSGGGAVRLSFETHHGGGVAPSPEFAACAASSCSAEIMVLLLLQRGELLVHHDRPSHHHRRYFPTPQPVEAAAAVEVGWGFQALL